MKFGLADIDNLKAGLGQVDRVYRGAALTWENIPWVPDGPDFIVTTNGGDFRLQAGANEDTLISEMTAVNGTIEKVNSIEWTIVPDSAGTDVEVYVVMASPGTKTNFKFSSLSSYQGATGVIFNAYQCNDMHNFLSALDNVTTLTATNTDSVDDMSAMLQDAISMTSLTLGNTDNVLDVSYMFIRSGMVNIGDLNFPSATAAPYMFYDALSLSSVGNINIPSATAFDRAFKGSAIQSIGVITSTLCRNFTSMAENCSGLTCIKGIDTTSQTGTTDMFTGCTSLSSPGAANQTLIEGGLNWLSTACDDVNEL